MSLREVALGKSLHGVSMASDFTGSLQLGRSERFAPYQVFLYHCNIFFDVQMWILQFSWTHWIVLNQYLDGDTIKEVRFEEGGREGEAQEIGVLVSLEGMSLYRQNERKLLINLLIRPRGPLVMQRMHDQ
ncbi:hypothetical protein DY000_02027540 [Brassica cretica]|uniref:Uncharacterized protein n=1 Tax=Brassica cretica TaxID=69181 RepID=A0ABQ7EH38_BRACR|nr:hypothetical protein DY000_02027540 [Brassica cretica]